MFKRGERQYRAKSCRGSLGAPFRGEDTAAREGSACEADTTLGYHRAEMAD
jgi:hypothetical protein